jgi:hypothetical protein
VRTPLRSGNLSARAVEEWTAQTLQRTPYRWSCSFFASARNGQGWSFPGKYSFT